MSTTGMDAHQTITKILKVLALTNIIHGIAIINLINSTRCLVLCDGEPYYNLSGTLLTTWMLLLLVDAVVTIFLLYYIGKNFVLSDFYQIILVVYAFYTVTVRIMIRFIFDFRFFDEIGEPIVLGLSSIGFGVLLLDINNKVPLFDGLIIRIIAVVHIIGAFATALIPAIPILFVVTYFKYQAVPIISGIIFFIFSFKQYTGTSEMYPENEE